MYANRLIFGFLTIIVSALLAYVLYSGTVYSKNFEIFRDKDPGSYWLLTCFLIFSVLVCLFISIFVKNRNDDDPI